ncbi:hypothetical protein [Pedococcus bigeumensis]|uniref:Uncharacterized protein n=1 Tax=Pedococcus bigeumensis TaxID=433644 RepID=A0A502CZI6_9MICO|nr:hypothetical protein [Pedococcus bigeumensis]TPG17171.1 hypothetical protein EAH86_10435 [Pedococcus bigeumensis]
MADVAQSSTIELLQYLHDALASHFHMLHAKRASLEPSSPVFALEHDLSPEDVDLLKTSVRAAVQTGLGARHRQCWLPFVVYAAESGYDYVGDEYWRSFERSTPGWRDDHRSWIKMWFQRFATEYGGAVPTGAFASTFTIIAWPITHGVLPRYLQRQLAQLLFEFSGALTSDLLDDPAALGLRLARRASTYTERFRIFCENTTLVGQVATALLSGKDEPTPYLLPSTLDRILADLFKEHQARHWLKSAQQSATRARGFRSVNSIGQPSSKDRALSRASDPRLILKFETEWNGYAELPDLTPLGVGLPDVFSQLRTSRGLVNGGARHVPPSGLLYPGQEVRFANWPRPDAPFLQLDRAEEGVNRVLADQCAISQGPWWLFRRQGSGLALEVKGKFVRPGHRYVLVGAGSVEAPQVSWGREVALAAEGARAYELVVPEQINESDEAVLTASGIGVVSHVSIRPVGVVASAWDGEGDVEWLAGEPGILGIRSDLLPKHCRLTIDGAVYLLDWSPEHVELLLSLEGLPVGSHSATVSLLGDSERQVATGSLIITIRDPRIRPEGAWVGEGIRMLAAPARPTLSELWDERVGLTIDGPTGSEAELVVTLRDANDVPLVDVKRSIKLPVDEDQWRATARALRKDQRFSDAYDEAESCVVTVSREGIGFASLTCERGFQPLRWRFARTHDGAVIAHLIDRTDGGNTTIQFFDVETPLVPVPKCADAPIPVPPRGGLAIARSGESAAAVILPTDPNTVFRLPRAIPSVSARTRTSNEIRRLAAGHAEWLAADLPADAFATYEQQLVGDAIARAIGTLIGGGHWAQLERQLATASDPADHLEAMQAAVGASASQKELASTIAFSLYRWLTPDALLLGFDKVIAPHLAACGVIRKPGAARFLLMLAGRPGYIGEWEASEADFLINRVLLSPMLYRAARFAVIGTRALNDADGVDRSF